MLLVGWVTTARTSVSAGKKSVLMLVGRVGKKSVTSKKSVTAGMTSVIAGRISYSVGCFINIIIK